MHIKPSLSRTLPLFALLAALAPQPAAAVSMATTTVNGLLCDVWTWTDAAGLTRTAALKKEGHGNAGHGGYLIQLTYVAGGNTITAKADTGSDGGFGYFVSHERYRKFADGTLDTIAGHIFGKDDSPLGLQFPTTTTFPTMPAGSGAERVWLHYGHYGTITPDPVDPDSGYDSVPLPAGQSNYKFYPLVVATTFVFQDGTNYPRIDVAIQTSGITPPGSTTPTADLVSFDVRGPYGVLVFDNGADATVNTVLWGDQEFTFAPTKTPVTRDSGWTWNTANKGARYQALQAGAFEMGLFEPTKLGVSKIVDGWAGQRGFTSTSYAASGGTSSSSCPSGAQQILPDDGLWPYQSVQYSLPCGSGQFNTPTNGKKLAWGSVAYFGTSLTSVYNGKKSFPFKGFFPKTGPIAYSVCLVLGQFPAGKSLTALAAATYTKVTPASSCATAK
jgi:hypothetical protein